MNSKNNNISNNNSEAEKKWNENEEKLYKRIQMNCFSR